MGHYKNRLDTTWRSVDDANGLFRWPRMNGNI